MGRDIAAVGWAATPLGPGDVARPWPLAQVLAGGTVVADGRDDRFPDLPTGGRDAGPQQAWCRSGSRRVARSACWWRD